MVKRRNPYDAIGGINEEFEEIEEDKGVIDDIEAINSITDLMNIKVAIPIIGIKKLSDLVPYVIPTYVKNRKDFRGIVPKNVDDMIMAYATEQGIIEPKRMAVKDLDIPLGEMDKMFETLHQEGYAISQIAKELNVNSMLVTQYFTDRRLIKDEVSVEKKKSGSRIRRWVRSWI